MDIAQWSRDLLNSSHLFDAEIAYFLATASWITNQGKTAVLNIEHGILLSRKIIQKQNYTVLDPPPIHDEFTTLYAKGAPPGTVKLPSPGDEDYNCPAPHTFVHFGPLFGSLCKFRGVAKNSC